MKSLDLKDKIFGRWLVLERANRHYTSGGNSKTMWLCQCTCENKTIKEVSTSSLINGHSKSCGCLNLERVKEPKIYNRQNNIFDLTTYEYGIGYDSNGNSFMFDKEDYELISQFCWRKHHNYYEAKDIRISSKKTIYLHKLLMGCEYEGRKVKVDHKDGDPSNNRKSNLRIATTAQNNINRKSNSKTGICGVVWHERDKQWEVKIGDTYIGRTSDFGEAVKMRAEAERERYGEFGFFESRQINIDDFISQKKEELQNKGFLEGI